MISSDIWYMGIILMIVIIALIFILKLMFTPPKKITQKQHEKKYKNALCNVTPLYKEKKTLSGATGGIQGARK